jgi:hypothetical protein
MEESDINELIRAAAERQLAVTALEEKYARSNDVPTEQLVKDMRELLATEKVILNAIIALFDKLVD